MYKLCFWGIYLILSLYALEIHHKNRVIPFTYPWLKVEKGEVRLFYITCWVHSKDVWLCVSQPDAIMQSITVVIIWAAGFANTPSWWSNKNQSVRRSHSEHFHLITSLLTCVCWSLLRWFKVYQTSYPETKKN